MPGGPVSPFLQLPVWVVLVLLPVPWLSVLPLPSFLLLLVVMLLLPEELQGAEPVWGHEWPCTLGPNH